MLFELNTLSITVIRISVFDICQTRIHNLKNKYWSFV